VDPTIYPGNSRSISAIALHAFALGITLSFCAISTIFLAQSHHRIWRLTEFIATLSLFHFLEFWTTARYNTSNAKVSSYLLTSNGSAYLSAHLAAMLEIIVTSTWFPSLQDSWSNTYTVLLGLALVIMGQVVRSIAMAQAGVSFNHIPAKSKKNDHVLVTKGLYSYLRHPSYFGYFFFAVGTQVVVGNKICCVSYLVILWFFFKDRINCKFSPGWMREYCFADFDVQTRNKIWSSSLVMIIVIIARGLALVFRSSRRYSAFLYHIESDYKSFLIQPRFQRAFVYKFSNLM
jgi:protein-S-isoprenylcysteine O-methyltransferase